jgi:uncharacterized repeat protein (TIGR01451 family)
MPKKIIPTFLILVMVLGTLGLASASDGNPIPPLKPNDPANALFTKTESIKELQIGDLETFTIKITNPNSAPASPFPAYANDFTNIKISDVVPDGLEVTSVSGGTFSGNDVTIGPLNLPHGQSKTITITAKAVKAGTYVNVATGTYMVNEGQFVLKCGKEEHTHVKSCYKMEKGDLICTCDPCNCGGANTHADCCYNWVRGTLKCTIPEHTHDGCCYKWSCCLVQRSLRAESDPTIIEPAPSPVKPVTPTINEKAAEEPTVKAQEQSVGMQETGAPLVALLLAGLMLFGGMLLPKRK